MNEKKKCCANCRYSAEVIVPQVLQKGYRCQRFPPSIPMPGPGGQGIIFVQPVISADTECGEHGEVSPILAS